MTDFFDSYGQTINEELARIYEAGAEGLRKRDIAPNFFDKLVRKDLIWEHSPEHYSVTRRGLIELERAHMLHGS